MENVGYFKRSWEALKLNPSWWKTIVLLSLASLVPVAGVFAVYGYTFRWGREAAWDMELPITNKVGDLGAVLKSGAIVFVCMFVWSCLMSLVAELLGAIPKVGDLLTALCGIAMVALMMVVMVMAMRGVIYDSFGATFQVRQAWDMVRREPNGIVRIFGMLMVFGVIGCVLVMPAIILLVVGVLVLSASAVGLGYETGVSPALYEAVVASMPAIVAIIIVLFLLVTFVSTLGQALVARALGYWVAQFKPATWGAASEGAPAHVGPRTKKQQEAQAAAQAASWQQAQYHQRQWQQPVQETWQQTGAAVGWMTGAEDAQGHEQLDADQVQSGWQESALEPQVVPAEAEVQADEAGDDDGESADEPQQLPEDQAQTVVMEHVHDGDATGADEDEGPEPDEAPVGAGDEAEQDASTPYEYAGYAPNETAVMPTVEIPAVNPEQQAGDEPDQH